MLRVMLIYHNPLFAHTIRTALREQPRIQFVGEVDDWTRAAVDIERLRPDVVVAEEDQREAIETMLRALQTRQSPWRVVAMRLDETAMHIWSGVWQPVTRAQDLLDALLQPPARRPKTRRHPSAL